MGSLFQLRDYWRQSFPGEEFSPSCIAVGDLDNQDAENKIAIGSFQGMLRLFQPSSSPTLDTPSPEDLLFEQRLGEPILQIAYGSFEPLAPGVRRNLLAVLFPYKLRLLCIERCGGGGSEGRDESKPGEEKEASLISATYYYRCPVVFTVEFDHPTYNFTTGPFGGVDYDRLCVQGMNGRWSVVDRGRILCACSLPRDGFVAPGCLTYCAARDSFLTGSASLHLLCYPFARLTSAAEGESEGNAASAGGRLAPSWGFPLGEEILAVAVCRLSRGLDATAVEIVVLGPFTLCVVSLDGRCCYRRPLTTEAACLHPFPLSNRFHNVLVGGWDGSVGVFSDGVLEWRARLGSGGAPLALHVGKLAGIDGMILSLTGEGVLGVSYLGTDPASRRPAPVLEAQVRSYAEMRGELRQVERRLKAIQSGKPPPSEAAASSMEWPSVDAASGKGGEPPPRRGRGGLHDPPDV
ncbi:unnamed protein product [Phytomonas sp. EM1]|nr:unnamed protein product [Phytomonas sp. EM1]|eukprot:CCW62783.1 unnamed protein product [Phytomonas sp. isolate EM1]